jgi:AcrR family transcriptional regulator
LHPALQTRQYDARVSDTEPVDGRTARSQRTRAAVVDALIDIISEGAVRPNANEIATRAGVSPRSIYVHFASLEDLYRAAAEKTTAMILALLTPIDPTEPLDVRIDLLCGQRARINEQVGPLLRAADRHEADSSELAAVRRFGRDASREQLERIFATELEQLDRGNRRRRVAAIDALLTESSWTLLRVTHRLDPDEARVAIQAAVHTLLTATDSPEPA